MVEVFKTDEFEKTFRAIRDGRAREKILVRIRRMGLGNPGDVRAVGAGVSEMRIDYGPGYRVYYVQTGQEIILLLTCGVKDTQDKDIATAKALKVDYT
jgi:putative addiction module killer protein